MNSFTKLWGDTMSLTDDTQYLKYKKYLYSRAIMEQYRTNCSDGTEIQMPSYTYEPYGIKYPFVKISHSDFLEYEKTIQEYINSFNEFLKTL